MSVTRSRLSAAIRRRPRGVISAHRAETEDPNGSWAVVNERHHEVRPGEGHPVLEIVAASKLYPGEPPVVALEEVTFRVDEGELVAIVGPSGSGKTTLLHLMGTLDRPSSGTVRITGLDVATMSDRDLSLLRAARIGFVFQQFFLAEYQTVIDNVADGQLYAGVTLSDRREQAVAALAKVGLAHKVRARPTQLSGGERQRVAIARALVGSPTILLADEPTGNLDSVNSQAILALLEDLNDQGSTILVITHERTIADRFPRRIEMLDGHIVADSARTTGRVSQIAQALQGDDT